MSFFFAFFIMTFSQAQNTEITGKVRIKLSEDMANTFEVTPFQKSSDGYIQVGNSALNRVHTQLKATGYKRVFPYAGKFEAKHRKYGLHLWYEIDIDKDEDVNNACATYIKTGSITNAEPIYSKTRITPIKTKVIGSDGIEQHTLEGVPNDPLFSDQWHYENTGQSGGTPGADISLLEAWGIETGNPDVIVSIHDGGIDIAHEDLINNLWINVDEISQNGIDDDNNGYIDDIYGYGFGDETSVIAPDGHGSHVAGTIGASTNNGVGVSGIAGGNGSEKGVKLMSCAVFGDDNSGNFGLSYIYAADNGSVISQNSWGYIYPDVYDQSVLDGIKYFIAEAGYDENGNPVGPMQGGVVLFAAGNSSSASRYYPGAFDEVITVAATDDEDLRAYYSNWGDWVQLAAPGSNIMSTYYSEDYNTSSGTSMACPHVSGVAALIVSKFAGSITPQQVRSRLIGTTDYLTDSYLGSGRLNAYKALQDNDNIAPEAITDLTVSDISKNMVSLNWTAPFDENEAAAFSYEIRYATEPLSEDNFENGLLAEEYILASEPGVTESFSIVLDISTSYYFAIKAIDLFGNLSDISNVVECTTNSAALIKIESDSLILNIDTSVDPEASTTFVINNVGNEELVYRTGVFSGYVNLLYLDQELYDPAATGYEKNTTNSNTDLESTFTEPKTSVIQNNITINDSIYYDSGDEEIDFYYGAYNSEQAFAVRFEVDKPTFELTHVRNYMNIDISNSDYLPVQLEIRKGSTLGNSELLLSQEFMPQKNREGFLTIPLVVSQQFEQNDVFWVIHKFSNAYSYPQGMEDSDKFPPKPNTYFFSYNGGGTYSEYSRAFVTRAISGIDHTVKIEINPELGIINPDGNALLSATFDASETIEGANTYSLIVNSNDPQNSVVVIPCKVNISGQLPSMSILEESIEFDTTFLGDFQTKEISIGNTGYADLEIEFSVYNSDFYIGEQSSITIPSGERSILPISFIPKESGTSKFTLKLLSNDPDTPEFLVKLTGISIDPPVIETNPELIITNLNSGETVQEKITVINSGNYPLSFSFPEYISISSTTENNLEGQMSSGSESSFGYSWIDSNDPDGPEFIWNDIKNTGTKIEEINWLNGFEFDLPFVFEFFGEEKTSLVTDLAGVVYFGEVGFVGINDIPSSSDEINDFIAVFNSSLNIEEEDANIYYQLTDNSVTIQYDNVSSNDESDINATFQIVLLKSGTIMLYYKDVTEFQVISKDALIGIENITGEEGLLVGGKYTEYVEDELAVKISTTATNYITDINPSQGIVESGEYVDVDLTIDANNLAEGEYVNDILMFSNDPLNLIMYLQSTLNVTGYQEAALVSPDTLNFETIFVSNESELTFVINNPGSVSLSVENIICNSNQFAIDAETPFEIDAMSEKQVSVRFTPNSSGNSSSIAKIITNVPESDTLKVQLNGSAVNPPIITVGTDSISVTANSGEKAYESLTIKNSGESALLFNIGAPVWIKADDNDSGYVPELNDVGNDSSFGYTWKDNKREDGPEFNFINIVESGVDITDDIDLVNPTYGSTNITIGFNFPFYDNMYNNVWVSCQGLLYFGDSKLDRGDLSRDKDIPIDDAVNNIIAGMWQGITSGDGVGTVHYLATEEYFIVQFTDVSFDADIVSTTYNFTFQMILYPNGNIKFQYKNLMDGLTDYESLITGSTIGIENIDGDDGFMITEDDYSFTNELAILIETPYSGTIPAGDELSLDITFDATYVYAGEYKDNITITSNDISDPIINIPVDFTVLGSAIIETEADTVDFGEINLRSDADTSVTKSFTISNIGARKLLIDTIYTDNSTFTTLFDGIIEIEPLESVTINITCTTNTFEILSGNLIIKSNNEENNCLKLPIKASTVDFPVLISFTESDTLSARVKLNGEAQQFITFGNSASMATLYYDATVSYLQIDDEFLTNKQSDVIVNSETVTDVEYDIIDSLYYDSSNSNEFFFGFDNESITTATKFTVGVEQNFDLSHIKNYYTTSDSEDSITIKVYLGGDSPNTGQLLLSQQHKPQATSGFELISLDEPQYIRAGETFWILIDYPLEMQYPQATYSSSNDNEIEYNVFYYSLNHGDSWTPLEYYYRRNGFQIRALSSVFGGWITLNTEHGEVSAGSDTNVEVQLNASGLASGTYYAQIDFNFNDPANLYANIPVRLNVNSVPVFYETPTDTLQLKFEETLELTLKAKDSDGEIISYTMNESYNNVSFSSEEDAARIRFEPDSSQSGYYNFTINAYDDMDDFGTTSFVVAVEGVDVSSTDTYYSTNEFTIYPNPFTDKTNIYYDLNMSSEVILQIYSYDGRLIEELVNENQNAGKHTVVFDGRNVSSGIYFYSISIDGVKKTKKMIRY